MLEPIVAYLMIAERQYNDITVAGSYNIGPNETDCWTTGDLVDLFCKEWTKQTGKEIKWINKYDGGPHEANFLKLDCSKVKTTFGWKPVWNVETTMKKIVEWSDVYLREGDFVSCMERQINEYMDVFGEV